MLNKIIKVRPQFCHYTLSQFSDYLNEIVMATAFSSFMKNCILSASCYWVVIKRICTNTKNRKLQTNTQQSYQNLCKIYRKSRIANIFDIHDTHVQPLTVYTKCIIVARAWSCGYVQPSGRTCARTRYISRIREK